jgi:hypothetical protein
VSFSSSYSSIIGWGIFGAAIGMTSFSGVLGGDPSNSACKGSSLIGVVFDFRLFFRLFLESVLVSRLLCLDLLLPRFSFAVFRWITTIERPLLRSSDAQSFIVSASLSSPSSNCFFADFSERLFPGVCACEAFSASLDEIGSAKAVCITPSGIWIF